MWLRCFGNLLHLLFERGQPPQGVVSGPQEIRLQDLANYLGLPVSTVHSRWKRAVLYLRRELQSFAPEGAPGEVGP